MPDYSWDDLKCLLAVHRAGTLAAAARVLGVNETTVARRLKALETGLSVRLLLRDASGQYEATDVAKRLIGHAETIEHESAAIEEAVGQASRKLVGTVRVTAPPIVVNKILVPELSSLRDRHPFITIELSPEARNVDMTRREADLAVRFARPQSGGLAISGQRIGILRFAAFGPASGDVPEQWIGYDDNHAHLPQAKWFLTVRGAQLGFMRVADAETALEAVACGLGIAFLPRLAALRDPRLRELGDYKSIPERARPVWLLAHVDEKVRASVSAVKTWLMTLPWDNDTP